MADPTNMADAQANNPTPAPAPDVPPTLSGLAPGDPGTAPTDGGTPPPADPPANTVTTVRTPESYELSVPEGTSMDKETLDEIAAYAAERGLSDEVANDLVKFRAEATQRSLEQADNNNKQALTDLRQQWRDELQADPQWGGDKMTQTVETAKRALDRFGTPELREALNNTGLGDHKGLLITFARIGAQMAEDTLVTGAVVSPKSQKSIAETLYGNPKE